MPNSLSLAFVEGLYADYIKDPASVPSDWKAYFESLSDEGPRPTRVGPSFRARSLFNPVVRRENGEPAAARPVNGNGADVSEAAVRQDRVDQLVRAYRVRGHMIAAIDPSQPPGDAKRAATEPGACAGDTTINTLLEEPTSPHELPPSYMDPLDPPEQPGDLIAPELIFTEPTPRRR